MLLTEMLQYLVPLLDAWDGLVAQYGGPRGFPRPMEPKGRYLVLGVIVVCTVLFFLAARHLSRGSKSPS